MSEATATTTVDAAAAAHDDEHLAHPLPVPVLLLTFAALMILTVITVAVTTVDFGYTANLVVALAIAFVKAVLVGMYFMHLRYDSPVNGFILLASLLFVTLFIAFALLDGAEAFRAVPPPAGLPASG